jgi:hypothetical protein
VLLIALVVQSQASLVFAQAIAPGPEAQSRAADLKRRGDTAMDSIHFLEAVDAYAQAYAITKDPALLYNRGRALEALGDFPGALEALEKFDAAANADLKARVPKLAELMTELRARVSSLRVTCNVAGARVLVREKVVGVTPLPDALRVTHGTAPIEVNADGYVPYRNTVALPGGGVLVLDVTLTRNAKTSVLVLRSSVPGTIATVDGKVVGNPPVEVEVEPGSHKILARAEGHADLETLAVVARGDQKQIDLQLKPRGGITTQWWFWTGLGVVVAGGAAVSAALLIEKKPSSGDLAPGTVSAPIRF